MSEPNPSHVIRIISDDKGHGMAKRLYEAYIKQEDGDNSRLPEFTIALDRLLSAFGGRPALLEEDEEEEGEESVPDAEEDDYAPDEDVHEAYLSAASEVDEVKAAVARVLAKGR